MPRVVVKAGDCISSIAERHGHFWETLWNHPDNAALKELRGDPNVLLAGDIVVVPQLRPKEVGKPSEARHRFRHRGVPGKCRIRLLKDGQPRESTPYILIVDGQSIPGTTDADGYLEADIPPDARQGMIRVRQGRHEEVYPLQFGGLDPIDTPAGMEQRLSQLGYRIAPDPADPIRAFQHDHGLSVTGSADDATRSRLREVYGQ